MTAKPLTVADVMAITGRSINVVGDALRSGALEGAQARPRDRWFITEQAVDRWISAGCPRYGQVAS